MGLNDYFLPYQRRWINDNAPMKLYPKSRRVGITFATSFRANDKCLRNPKGFKQWVTSRDELTAKEFVTDYIAKWASASNIVCKGLMGEDFNVVDKDHGIRGFSVLYENGNRIISLSSTPEAFAGKGGDVLVDEADLHKDSGKVIDMALPCMTWGGQLEMVSALRVDGGPNTPFCKMVKDVRENGNPMGWSLHCTSILDAVDDGFVEKLNEVTGGTWTRDAWLKMMQGRCRTPEAWQTQYLIVPSSDGQSLLSWELIQSCEVSQLLAMGDGARYAGYDVGRKKDLGVYFELEKRGDVLWQTDYRIFEKAPFRVQMDYVAKRLDDSRLKRVCVDATGMGMMLAEELETRFGRYRVEGVTFTPATKEEMAMLLLATFQDRNIRIIAENDLREDLHKIVKTTTASGHVRYEGERDDLGHSDRFWSLGLARLAAGKMNDGPVFMQPSTIVKPEDFSNHWANLGSPIINDWRY